MNLQKLLKLLVLSFIVFYPRCYPSDATILNTVCVRCGSEGQCPNGSSCMEGLCIAPNSKVCDAFQNKDAGFSADQAGQDLAQQPQQCVDLDKAAPGTFEACFGTYVKNGASKQCSAGKHPCTFVTAAQQAACNTILTNGYAVANIVRYSPLANPLKSGTCTPQINSAYSFFVCGSLPPRGLANDVSCGGMNWALLCGQDSSLICEGPNISYLTNTSPTNAVLCCL